MPRQDHPEYEAYTHHQLAAPTSLPQISSARFLSLLEISIV